jgi:hypothetical protein
MKQKVIVIGSLPGRVLETLKEQNPEADITVVESASEVLTNPEEVTILATPVHVIKPMDKSIIQHSAQIEWQFNNTLRKKTHIRDYKYHK